MTDFYASAGAEDDRSNFYWGNDLTNDELLDLYIENEYMSLLCNWRAAEALKNGWVFLNDGTKVYLDEDGNPAEASYMDYCEVIMAKPKFIRAMALSDLMGSALAVFFGDDENFDSLKEPREDGVYNDFEVYHKLAKGNGWEVADIDWKGQPTMFKVTIQTEGMKKPKIFQVSAKRCVVFCNPRKEERWDGTPDSKLIDKVCKGFQMIKRAMIKRALLLAVTIFRFGGVLTEDQATGISNALHEALNPEKFYGEMYDTLGAEAMECIIPPVVGNGGDFKTIADEIKSGIAVGSRVSQQAMDGAPQGTLSSAGYNTLLSYEVIEQKQSHFKTYLEKCFKKLGFVDPNIQFVKPLNENEMRSPNESGNGRTGEEDGRGTKRGSVAGAARAATGQEDRR